MRHSDRPEQVVLTMRCAGREEADKLASALQELIEPAPHAVSLFEDGSNAWRIDAYYSEYPGHSAILASLESVLGCKPPQFEAAPVIDRNWVAISQAALPPVKAGRFTIHGSHDNDNVARGPNSILIDAGEAFGTAHHPTTLGCLRAIDRLSQAHAHRRILDLGCGSGILTIAAARAWPCCDEITASDIDAQSVVVASQNANYNGVTGARGLRTSKPRIRIMRADGITVPQLAKENYFDLVIANILADPLIRLARTISNVTAPGGNVILSGLLTPQAAPVIAAYRAAGMIVKDHRQIGEWSTLSLSKRSSQQHADRTSWPRHVVVARSQLLF